MSQHVGLPRQSQQTMNLAIEKLKQLNQSRAYLVQKNNKNALAIALTLEEIKEGNYAELTRGCSFNDFITLYLEDEYGNPRTVNWARGILTYLKTIRKWPVLYQLMLQSHDSDDTKERVISLSQGYYLSRIADESAWQTKTVKEMITDGWVSSQKGWEEEKQKRLAVKFLKLADKSIPVLKDILRDLRKENGTEEEASRWTFHGGKVTPEILEDLNSVVERLLKASGDTRRPENLSYVQTIELITSVANDMLDASDALSKGNTSPLKALFGSLRATEEEE